MIKHAKSGGYIYHRLPYAVFSDKIGVTLCDSGRLPILDRARDYWITEMGIYAD